MNGQGSEARDTFKLTEVLNFLHAQKRTGRLLIRGVRHSGEVFLVDGRITHALIGPCVGLKALYLMLFWTEGEYNFTPGESTDYTTIDPETVIVMELLSQQMQEWVLMNENKTLDLNCPLRLLPQTRGTIRLTKEEWEILAHIDGKKTLKQISDDLYMPPPDLIKKIHRFLEAGLIGDATPYSEAAYAILGERFLSLLEQELRQAVGPMASMIIEEALSELAEETSLPISHKTVDILLEKLSNAINSEEQRVEFRKVGIALAKEFAKTSG